ncbi:ATP-binding protein [Gammaproteobacteria bacterium]|nr:ATP-binding protein [Gammaproteobacteria bacterium]
MVTKKIENPADSFDKTLDQVVELLDGEEQQFIYLTGAAGTGKTTLIERVVDECSLKKNGGCPHWCCCFKYRWKHYQFSISYWF